MIKIYVQIKDERDIENKNNDKKFILMCEENIKISLLIVNIEKEYYNYYLSDRIIKIAKLEDENGYILSN